MLDTFTHRLKLRLCNALIELDMELEHVLERFGHDGQTPSKLLELHQSKTSVKQHPPDR